MITHVSPHPYSLLIASNCFNELAVPDHRPCEAIIGRWSYESYVLGEWRFYKRLWCGAAFEGCLGSTSVRSWSRLDRKTKARISMTLHLSLFFSAVVDRSNAHLWCDRRSLHHTAAQHVNMHLTCIQTSSQPYMQHSFGCPGLVMYICMDVYM